MAARWVALLAASADWYQAQKELQMQKLKQAAELWGAILLLFLLLPLSLTLVLGLQVVEWRLARRRHG